VSALYRVVFFLVGFFAKHGAGNGFNGNIRWDGRHTALVLGRVGDMVMDNLVFLSFCSCCMAMAFVGVSDLSYMDDGYLLRRFISGYPLLKGTMLI
jgi:hypothetical protein